MNPKLIPELIVLGFFIISMVGNIKRRKKVDWEALGGYAIMFLLLALGEFFNDTWKLIHAGFSWLFN